eukprot:scaffold171416_cov21-Tisochrysis_lutea.AAC.1
MSPYEQECHCHSPAQHGLKCTCLIGSSVRSSAYNIWVMQTSSVPVTIPAKLCLKQEHCNCSPVSPHIHFVQGKYCQDTRRKDQIKATPQPLLPSFKGLSTSFLPYHSDRCGRGRLHPSHFGAPSRARPDTHKATMLALNLHAHSVQYAYKVSSSSHALEKTSLCSHQQGQRKEKLCSWSQKSV